jgi:deoxyribodipyrimidine photolyase-related protein
VREDLDRWQKDEGVAFVGDDGPRRFAVTRVEAVAALESFVAGRLAAFGPYEDAMLAGDPGMSHSLLSAPLNLGLLHPLEVARRAERAYRDGSAPLASVEGFVRQVVGWREYVWQLYWHFGEDYRHRNELDARQPLPSWWTELDAAGEVTRPLPCRRPGLGPPRGLDAPHPAADGAGQPGPATGPCNAATTRRR